MRSKKMNKVVLGFIVFALAFAALAFFAIRQSHHEKEAIRQACAARGYRAAEDVETYSDGRFSTSYATWFCIDSANRVYWLGSTL